MTATELGRIVVLNGAPRSGKSSIAAAIQAASDRPWMNLGVDTFMRATPERFRPGIGLRPGGERPDLEPMLPDLYAALYASMAAHSRLGLDVVADLGHHEGHSRPLGILARCASLLAGLPALLVGVRCPVNVIMARRRSAPGTYLCGTEQDPVPAPVSAWQHCVHAHGIYDLEVDTSVSSPADCAAAIGRMLHAEIQRPAAFERLATNGTG